MSVDYYYYYIIIIIRLRQLWLSLVEWIVNELETLCAEHAEVSLSKTPNHRVS